MILTVKHDVKRKSFAIFILTLGVLSFLHAQDSRIVGLISALNSGDIQAIEKNLEMFTLGIDSVHAEKIVLDKARSLILSNQLDQALSVCELLLLFNLDNIDAQDLYNSIDRLKQDRKAFEEKQRIAAELAQKQAEEQKRKLDEQARKEAEIKAKQAQEEARLSEIERIEQERLKRVAHELAEKEKFVQSIREIGIDNFSLLAYIAPYRMPIAVSDFANDYRESLLVNILYGVSSNLQITFTHPYIALSASAHYAKSLVLISNSTSLDNELEAIARIWSPALGIPLTIRIGYMYKDWSPVADVLYTQISTPIVGMGLQDLQFSPNLWASIWADYGLSAIMTPNIALMKNKIAIAFVILLSLIASMIFAQDAITRAIESAEKHLIIKEHEKAWSYVNFALKFYSGKEIPPASIDVCERVT
jgi:hypothetical protein